MQSLRVAPHARLGARLKGSGARPVPSTLAPTCTPGAVDRLLEPVLASPPGRRHLATPRPPSTSHPGSRRCRRVDAGAPPLTGTTTHRHHDTPAPRHTGTTTHRHHDTPARRR